MKKLICAMLVCAIVLPAAATVQVTGNPVADGFTYIGHSLQNGVYVRGEANYGFECYSAGLTIDSGSNLVISDGDYSWNVGDTVLAVGGRFSDITADAAGWAAFSGDAVNSLLSPDERQKGPKLQAKFGVKNAWSASTLAPDTGNGAGSGSLDDHTIQIRTSAYFVAVEWADNANQLMYLDKSGHIDWAVSSDNDLYRVTRLIWTYDNATGKPGSWEILLNVSLLGRLYQGVALPGIGNEVIMTVQDTDNEYTDALVTITAVPEPATLALLGLGGLLLRKKR